MAEFKRNMDYIDVAARLTEMRKSFPELSMQQVKMEFVFVADKDWVVYTAAAYRTPEDIRPGIGTAWEPIPGPTPYTKDSEVQNAETAAWGRALIAIGASTKNGIASHEEVTNRQGPSDYEQQQHERPAGVNNETGEIDPRVEAILQAAETGENNFVNDLAMKFTKYGSLSEAQMEKGFNAAAKILGRERQVTQRREPGPFAPPEEQF
jgi:hypothetical protein